MHASVLRVETERDIGPGDRELRGGGGNMNMRKGATGGRGRTRRRRVLVAVKERTTTDTLPPSRQYTQYHYDRSSFT